MGSLVDSGAKRKREERGQMREEGKVRGGDAPTLTSFLVICKSVMVNVLSLYK